MLTLKQLFLGLFLPAVVSGGFLIVASALFFKQNAVNTEKRETKSSNWLIALALSAGYIVGYLGLEGLPTFPPRLGAHWLCYLAVIGLIVGGFWNFSFWGRLIAKVALAVMIPRLLLTPTFKHTWGQFEGIIWWVCLAATIFIFFHLVQLSFTTLISRASVPFVYFGLSGGTALILALSGALRLAQHGGILVALFVASWMITLVLQRRFSNWNTFPPNAVPIVTLLLAGIWMNGYFFEEVPTASAILLLISLLFVHVGRIGAIQRLGGRRSALAQIAAIALPVVIAIGIAIARSGLFGDNGSY